MILDAFDRHDMWEDTMLIVCTDHGIMLGEHGKVMKNLMPLYEEISHTPLLVYDPRHPESAGTRSGALVQPAIDMSPTLHDFFEVETPETVTGHDLAPALAGDFGSNGREAALFGYFKSHVNLVTERYAYYRGGDGETPQHAYTVMPWQMRQAYGIDQLVAATQADPLADSQKVRPLKIPAGVTSSTGRSTLLFDLAADPAQGSPVEDATVVEMLEEQMVTLMHQADAPVEQFQRLGLG